MNWLDRAEVKFGHLAIPGLLRIVVGFNVLVFILYSLTPPFLATLNFDVFQIRHGEIWRLVSYLFIPQFGAPIRDWIPLFGYLYFLWFVGDGLEQGMGSFKLNVFYFSGMVATTIAAWFTGFGGYSNGLLNTSMLLALARFYPELVVYLMLILPVKIKWLAWGAAAALAMGLSSGGWSYRLVLLATVGNYLLFFGPEMARDAQHRGQVARRRERFEKDSLDPEAEPLHRCATCGRTEASSPDLEFRVSRDGREYCRQHLPQAPVNS